MLFVYLKNKDDETIIFLKKQQDVLAFLQKDCSLRETTKILYVCKSSVQRLCKKHFFNEKLLVGGKSRKLTKKVDKCDGVVLCKQFN